MRWTVHGERSIYDSDWVNLRLVDVELPDGSRFEHHVVRLPRPAVGTVVADPDRGVLLLWRHRFIPDRWGWEIPAGRVEADEGLADAARRETLEETGWRPGPLTPLVDYHPTAGLSDQLFSLFVADSATEVTAPSDPNEASEVAWVPVDRLRAIVTGGEMPDGLSLTAVLWCLATGVIAG